MEGLNLSVLVLGPEVSGLDISSASVAINHTAESTSSTSGALQILGGLAVSKALNLGIATIPTGFTTEINGTTPVLNMEVNFHSSGKNTTYGGGAFRVDMRNPSAFTANGGIFNWITRQPGSTTEVTVANMNGFGDMVYYSTTDATSTTTGSLQVKGGMSIGKSLLIRSTLVQTASTYTDISTAVSGDSEPMELSQYRYFHISGNKYRSKDDQCFFIVYRGSSSCWKQSNNYK